MQYCKASKKHCVYRKRVPSEIAGFKTHGIEDTCPFRDAVDKGGRETVGKARVGRELSLRVRLLPSPT
jgi:hypothetical protein